MLPAGHNRIYTTLTDTTKENAVRCDELFIKRVVGERTICGVITINEDGIKTVSSQNLANGLNRLRGPARSNYRMIALSWLQTFSQ